MALIPLWEMLVAGENGVTADDVDAATIETPPVYRFADRKLMDQGVIHLKRIRKEHWKVASNG